MSSNRMLINATQPEELRVAIVRGPRLEVLDIERAEGKKANIYKGKVSRVEPSLGAAFVDFGAEKHGFLPIKEVAPQYFADPKASRPNIKEALKPGQEIIVQVEKEERGTKGAAITTFIGLAGCYLVLMPNNPRAGGISRRIAGEERQQLQDILDSLPIPDGMGVIVRTAGLGRSHAELEWDLNMLLSQWKAIEEVTESRSAPFLIHQESDVIVRAIRDHLRPEITEILVDTQDAYDRAREFIQKLRPEFLSKIEHYSDDIPLFNRYQIESQIETAYQREVVLPNGGSIVIDPAEALTAIDINSARATEGVDIEETATKTNLAAAEEIARQIRLRDTGGLIVIDFIDMHSPNNQRSVENALRDALSLDRARIQIGRISRFGLLEMSRQRLRPSLEDAHHHQCPRCEGQGQIRTIRSLSLAILRMIEEEAMKPNTGQVQAQVPVEVATFLLNEKRGEIQAIEGRQSTQVLLLPNPNLEMPHYKVERIRSDNLPKEGTNSYELIESVEPPKQTTAVGAREGASPEQPAVKALPAVAAPPAARSDNSIISRLWSAVFGGTGGPDRPNGEGASQMKEESSTSSGGNNQRGGQNRQRNYRRGGGGGSDSGNNNRRYDSRRGGRGGRGRGGQNRHGSDEIMEAGAYATRPNDQQPNTYSRNENAEDDQQGGQGGQGERRGGGRGGNAQEAGSANANSNNRRRGGRRRGGQRRQNQPKADAPETTDQSAAAYQQLTPEQQWEAKEKAMARDIDSVTIVDQPDVPVDNNAYPTDEQGDVNGNVDPNAGRSTNRRGGNNRGDGQGGNRRRRSSRQYGGRRNNRGEGEENTNSSSTQKEPTSQVMEPAAPATTQAAPAVAAAPTPPPVAQVAPAVAPVAEAKVAAPKKEEPKQQRVASRMPPPVSPLASQAPLEQVVSRARDTNQRSTTVGEEPQSGSQSD